MNRAGVIARNIGHLTAGYTASRLLQIVFLLAVSVFYDSETYGLFSFLLATVLLGAVLADAGLDQVITREIARRRQDAATLLPSLLTLRLGFTLLAAVVLAAYVVLSPQVPSSALLVAGVVWMAAATLCLMWLRSALRAFDRMDAEAVSGLVERALQVGGGIGVLAAGGGPAALLAAFAFGTTAGTVYAAVVLVRGIAPLRLGWDRGLWAIYLRLALPFWLSAITVELLHRVDVQLLLWLARAPLAENGRYGVAFRLVEGTFLVPQIIAIAMLPQLSIRHRAEGIPASLVRLPLRLLWVVSVPIAALVLLVFQAAAPHVNETWLAAVPVIVVMAGMIPFVFANYLLGVVLAAADRQAQNLRAALAALAATVVVDAALIPAYGASGAALGVVVGQLVYLAGLFTYTRRLLPDLAAGRPLLAVVAATAASAALAYPLARLATGVPAQSAAGLLAFLFVYAGVAWLLGAWTPGDLRHARALLPGRGA